MAANGDKELEWEGGDGEERGRCELRKGSSKSELGLSRGVAFGAKFEVEAIV